MVTARCVYKVYKIVLVICQLHKYLGLSFVASNEIRAIILYFSAVCGSDVGIVDLLSTLF